MVKRQSLQRLYEIVEVGASNDRFSRFYDFFGVFCILLNLAISVLLTYDGIASSYGSVLEAAEMLTVLFFAADYVLRLLTARFLYPEKTPQHATRSYILSFMGIIDLLSFLPSFLPFFLPSGAVAFRLFRLVRIFRLFRISSYYDSLNVIKDVMRSKRDQLLSSIFMIFVLMLASSLCMYSLEHEAQPDVFRNAFSGIWWSVSTLLTVGYGDIYPLTTAGKVFSIILTFLGVGMVAIPTGIISAGFVEQYTAMKHREDLVKETDMRDVDLRELVLREDSDWIGKYFYELGPSTRAQIVLVMRDDCAMIPNERFVFRVGDQVVMYSMQNTDNVL